MAQFDVHRLGDLLVIDLQSDLIGLDESRLVAPLRDGGRYETLRRLTPEVEVDGRKLVAHVHDVAVVGRNELGKPLGNLRDHADALLRAVDILTRGF